jgi:hypothetical protein
MNAAQQDIGHAVTIAGIRRFLRKNPDGSFGPHFIEPEKTSRPPTPAQGQAVGVSDEAKREKAHRVAAAVLRDASVIAGESKDAETVYAYNGRTHQKTRLALRFAITEVAEVWQHIWEIVGRVDQLGTAVAALERLKSFFYRGTWDASEEYDEGDFCTDRGSLWTCLAPTRSRPGSNSDWQLAVKRGKNGKDAR